MHACGPMWIAGNDPLYHHYRPNSGASLRQIAGAPILPKLWPVGCQRGFATSFNVKLRQLASDPGPL